jgi:hypothetical protein
MQAVRMYVIVCVCVCVQAYVRTTRVGQNVSLHGV